MKYIFAIILMSNRDVLFKVPSLNVLDQSILMILASSLTVELYCSVGRIRYFSLENIYMNLKKGHQTKGRKWKRYLKENYLV